MRQHESDLVIVKMSRFVLEFDDAGDVHSLHRCLDRPLFLIVERKLGNAYHWDLPTLVRKDGETLRQTAERAGKPLIKK